MNPVRHVLLPGGASGLAGCSGLQSALDPLGPNAREIETLWWAMAGGSVLIFALVLGLLLYAVYGSSERRRRVRPDQLIVAGGIVLPVVVLSALVPFNVVVSSGSTAERTADTLTIRVHGHQWWWDIEYQDGTPGGGFRTANELYLPVGEPVELILTSSDVIHSLWIPRLGGKLDLIPGHTNRLMVEADQPGVSRGQCAEFCGVGHSRMALYAVAVAPREFESWKDAQRAAAADPASAEARRGSAVFAASGCALCHTVRGHDAWGQIGPDLTHVGGRLTIGAGLLDNNRHNLARWIADNDRLKAGNRMPDYVDLDEQTLTALGAYLEGLE